MNVTLDEHERDFWRDVNARIREGRADVEAGRVFDGEEVMNEILFELEEQPPKR